MFKYLKAVGICALAVVSGAALAVAIFALWVASSVFAAIQDLRREKT